MYFLKWIMADKLLGLGKSWGWGGGEIALMNMGIRTKTSIPKGNDRSPENKQVFLNSSLVSKDFFNWSRAANSAVHG